ncbi:ArsR family transcriptional regulator [Bifidobacterium xylocopae]|uniref:ArsR family transcriptional regulator n=2 Tax=Bifidobacterium xylocopae TaxID=2493119 RepID=A0A366KF87_9BIFI|nr:ArsR family transcriptional regulator [Bifidobacterium xylocopae]
MANPKQYAQKDYLEAVLASSISPMDYMQARSRQPGAYVLVDVRNAPPEKKQVKASGAVELPLQELRGRLGELPRDRTIVVYCWDVWCNMGKKASLMLLEEGFDVMELAGGIAAWRQLGLPTENL